MNLTKKKFIHLRNYTQYSLSKGAIKINELVDLCVKNKIPAVSISDFNNLFGCMEFSIECFNKGIQPIIGANIFVKDQKLEPGYILLICKNETGFRNLSKLLSFSYLNNLDNSDVFTNLKDIKKLNNGLMCLAGGQFGLITQNFLKRDHKYCDLAIKSLADIFQSNFFLEIQRVDKNKENYENYIINYSSKTQIPLIATNENFFISKNFYSSHDALLAISDQKYIESDDRLKSNAEYYFRSEVEMNEKFSDIPFICDNTELIAKKCSFFLKEKNTTLPKIYKQKSQEDDFLKKKSQSGLLSRLNTIPKESSDNFSVYKKRLSYELEIITKMGYSSYFLIVSDFINWAKKNSIPVGPGRGSGAGSLVAWSLFITDLDPIKFGLLFERFLNPDRISMPDFDVDFCMEKRDEVIGYVQNKYGKLNVAQIITFGSFQARAAIRDVGRVIQLPLKQVDDICKMIPYNPAQQVSLKETINDNKIKKLIKNNLNLKKLFKISIDLEGLYRHASTHAAGIVISDSPLVNSLPLYKDIKSDIPVTQFSMKYVEKNGLIKFDFLGLKTLTVINKACNYLREKNIKINIDSLPLNDFKTFELLKKGDTTGVFQLEGQGMKETLRKVMPDRFEDIIAVVSLYRPGPMDNIPTYINRKQNKEDYDYLHPSLKEILSETYGIMVYQEQVMLIAQKLAGFSLAKADLLRRAMGKKIKSEMQAQRSNFVKGCLKNDLDEEEAIKLFSEIEKFAGYGFNKSHAAAYAMIAYQTAYLKANHPLEFFCSLMNCDIGNFDKISNYCLEVKRLNFKIFTPDINNSDVFFKVVYNEYKKPIGISYGLSAIKNIGENSVQELYHERKINGQFKSLLDFLKRLNNKIINKKIIEALIFSGSLNSIENNQNYLLENLDKLISFNVNFHKNLEKNQVNLFSDSYDQKQFDSSDFKRLSSNKILALEYEAFGFYLSDHPSKIYKNINTIKNITDLGLLNDSDLDQIGAKSNFTCICLISDLKERISKTGKKYCFLSLSDDTGIVDAICFSEVIDSLNSNLKVGEIILVKLSYQNVNNFKKFTVSSVTILDDSNKSINDYLISLDTKKLDLKKLEKLLMATNTGKTNFFFKIFHGNHEIKIKSNKQFNANIDLLHSLKNTEGIIDITKLI